MSYDVGVTSEPCPTCKRERDADSERWNYTSNCGPMWRHAGANLAEFAGKRAGDCAVILRAAIARMEADPATYEAMNPENGWGSYDRLLPALRRLAGIFESSPDGVVWVSR